MDSIVSGFSWRKMPRRMKKVFSVGRASVVLFLSLCRLHSFSFVRVVLFFPFAGAPNDLDRLTCKRAMGQNKKVSPSRGA